MSLFRHAPFLLLLLLRPLRAEVWVYPTPDPSMRSPEYAVTVSQGGHVWSSFVYADRCQDPELRPHMVDSNHWTTFSFSGGVDIEVTRLRGTVPSVTLRPNPARTALVIKNRTISFHLDHPAKLWVRIPGAEKEPLFIFADPPERDIPDPHDPNVIWFPAGKVTGIGAQFRVRSGQTLYLPGGSYVKGTITGNNVSHVTIRGRGILSGIAIPRHPGVAGIPWNEIQFTGNGTDEHVEGITITDPPHFCILSRGRIDVRDVKLFGWWYQTDGWGGGPGSTIEDSFLKVNDDNVKFYAANQMARRLVVYQQINGAVFQLGWGGASQSAHNCVAQDIDVIQCENVQRDTRHEGNQALLSLIRQNPASVIDGVRIADVRVDSDLTFLVGLKQVAGTVRNITLRNVTVHGRVRGANFLRTNGSGVISNLKLDDVAVVGNHRTAHPSMRWAISGNVSPPVVVSTSRAQP